jgi:hypothetical protein
VLVTERATNTGHDPARLTPEAFFERLNHRFHTLLGLTSSLFSSMEELEDAGSASGKGFRDGDS